MWTGDPKIFMDALVGSADPETGKGDWLDPDGRLHDWDEYGGKMTRIKEGNRTRQKAWRDRHKTASPLPEIPTVTSPETDRNAVSHVSNTLVTRPSNEESRARGEDRTGQDKTGQGGGTLGVNFNIAVKPLPEAAAPPPSATVTQKTEQKPSSEAPAPKAIVVSSSSELNTNPRPSIMFAPVKSGLYPREYDELLKTAKSEARKLFDSPASWEIVLTPEAQDLINLLTKEGKTDRANEIKKRQDAYKRGAMKPKQASDYRSWQQRIKEIEAAKNGVICHE
jgi:hypothetical protein